MSKSVHFDYWENAKYGDPVEHYRTQNISTKRNRTTRFYKYCNQKRKLQPGRILEIGCNSGRNLDLFYDEGWEVFGVDINKSSIDFCNKRFEKNNKNFVVHDMFNDQTYINEFSDNFFDVCFSMGVLMHMPPAKEKTSLINEMSRVSKNLFLYELFDHEQKNPNIKFLDYDSSSDEGNYVFSEDYRQYGHDLEIVNEMRQNRMMFFQGVK